VGGLPQLEEADGISYSLLVTEIVEAMWLKAGKSPENATLLILPGRWDCIQTAGWLIG